MNRLKNFRLYSNYTMQQAAEFMKTSEAYYKLYEIEDKKLPTYIVEPLAKAYGVDAKMLAGEPCFVQGVSLWDISHKEDFCIASNKLKVYIVHKLCNVTFMEEPKPNDNPKRVHYQTISETDFLELKSQIRSLIGNCTVID